VLLLDNIEEEIILGIYLFPEEIPKQRLRNV